MPPDLNAITTPRSCDKVGDGTIDLQISGITPFIIYWNTDGTGGNDDPEDLTNLQVGNYTVTVSDANNCLTSLNTAIVSADCCKTSFVCLLILLSNEAIENSSSWKIDQGKDA